MKRLLIPVLGLAVIASLAAFTGQPAKQQPKTTAPKPKSAMQAKVDEYAKVKLTSDLTHLTSNERQIVGIFIDIAQIMDELFWEQSFGNKKALDKITDPAAKAYAMINYGPWDRLDNMKPFVAGYGEKPKGANFYPADMTEQEFEALSDPNKKSQYTVLKRNAQGKLEVVWYKDAYKEKLTKVIELMKKAAALAEDPGLKKYLELRIQAFQTDDYLASDLAWMDMKQSNLDFVVGPIENYEDKIFGYKAAYESFVLIKDKAWSDKLTKFTAMLPDLQKDLPCEAKYKKEVPGTDSDLNAYDVVYYAGDCNSGSKTIAINLPNDERVHLQKGTRRLQLKNAMKAKFDKIVMPIAKVMLDESQLKYVKFDAFFSNVMFHEVAHGLGIKNTITGKGNVRQALKNQYSAWEEAKADILGLYMVESLINKGEVTDCTVEDAYMTFIIGFLRSVRFGAASAHGQANMMCYNFFEEKGAIERTKDNKYHINLDKAKIAMKEWAAFVLKVEGDGDYDFAVKYNQEHIVVGAKLKADLEKIAKAGIPRDIVFEQGKKELGL